jgi:hypothetical protein
MTYFPYEAALGIEPSLGMVTYLLILDAVIRGSLFVVRNEIGVGVIFVEDFTGLAARARIL